MLYALVTLNILSNIGALTLTGITIWIDYREGMTHEEIRQAVVEVASKVVAPAIVEWGDPDSWEVQECITVVDADGNEREVELDLD